MLLRSRLVHSALASACALLVLTAAVAAGDPPVDATQGKKFVASFDPGFKFSTKHTACIESYDSGVVEPIGAKQGQGDKYPFFGPSKKQAFPFRAVAPGETQICIRYKDTASEAQAGPFYVQVEVTADLKVVLKQVKLTTAQTSKQIATKLKNGLVFFCGQLKEIALDAKQGEIDLCEAYQRMEQAAGWTAFGLGAAFAQCLREYSGEASELMIDAALDEVLPELQAGSCVSQFDRVGGLAEASYDRFTRFVDAKIAKTMKGLAKKSDFDMTMVTNPNLQVLQTVPLPTVGKGSPIAPIVAPTIDRAAAFRKGDDGVGLILQGKADSIFSELDVRLTDRSGGTATYTTPLSEVPFIGEMLGSDFPFSGSAGDRQSTFLIEITPSIVTPSLDPGGEPALDLDQGGPLLIELIHPGDATACFAQIISLP